jgi:hypothetical protein
MSSDISDTQTKRRRLGLMAALAVVIITSIPQLTLSLARGSHWFGSYAILDYDELTYSAYLNSLIQAKGRTTNPFSGSGEQTRVARENYYSIQFVPPYLIVGLSKLFPFSSSTAFIIMLPLLAFLSSLTIFWLLYEVSGDDKLAAIGLLIVLLCGRLLSENPLAPSQAYATFAFLRRYIPAHSLSFFLCFLRLHMAGVFHENIARLPVEHDSWIEFMRNDLFVFLFMDRCSRMAGLYYCSTIPRLSERTRPDHQTAWICRRSSSIGIYSLLLLTLEEGKDNR